MTFLDLLVNDARCGTLLQGFSICFYFFFFFFFFFFFLYNNMFLSRLVVLKNTKEFSSSMTFLFKFLGTRKLREKKTETWFELLA
jgi:hypothetical protein